MKKCLLLLVLPLVLLGMILVALPVIAQPETDHTIGDPTLDPANRDPLRVQLVDIYNHNRTQWNDNPWDSVKRDFFEPLYTITITTDLHGLGAVGWGAHNDPEGVNSETVWFTDAALLSSIHVIGDKNGGRVTLAKGDDNARNILGLSIWQNVTIENLILDGGSDEGKKYAFGDGTAYGTSAIQYASGEINITNSAFINSTAEGIVGAGGGGLYLLYYGARGENDPPTFTAITPTNTGYVTLTNVDFIDNKAIITDAGTGGVYGGGVAIDNFKNVQITGGTIKNNHVINQSIGNAIGGGMRSNAGVISVTGTTFIGNTAETKGAASAFGGALHVSNATSAIITDTNFTDNAAISDGGTARGGAIWTNTDLVIKAEGENVVFSGNEVSIDGGTTRTGNDIYLAGGNTTLTLEAATGKSITFGGGLVSESNATMRVKGNVVFDIKGDDDAIVTNGNLELEVESGAFTTGDAIMSNSGNITINVANNSASSFGNITAVDGDIAITFGNNSSGNVKEIDAGGNITYTLGTGSHRFFNSFEGTDVTFKIGNSSSLTARDSADGSIVARGKIEVDLDTDASLYASSIAAEQDVNLNVASGSELEFQNTVFGNTLNVTGHGTAHLGVVTREGTGNVKIGENNTDTTHVSMSIDSILGEDSVNILGTKATLELVGNETGVLTDLGTWTGTGGTAEGRGTLLDIGGIFTGYQFNDAGFIEGYFTESARMSDGFLAAFGIHNRYAAWNSVRDQMIVGPGRSSNAYPMPRYARSYQSRSYRGQSSCGCSSCSSDYGFDPCSPVMFDPCGPVVSDPCAPLDFYSSRGGSVGNNAWINYSRRGDAYQSSYRGNWKLSMEGVQAGSDLLRTRNAQFGMIFGYETGDMTNTSDRIKAKDMYVGAYVARVFRGGADVRGVYAYGWQDYKMNRFQQSDAFYYRSSFKGNTSEAHLELGKRLSPGPMSLRPLIAVDLLHNRLKGAAESNTDALADNAVRYGKTDLTQVFLRAGTELLYNMHFLTFNSGVYYSYDLNGAEPGTYVSLVRDSEIGGRLVGPKMGRSLLTFNAGSTCYLTDYFSIIGGYQGEYMFDRNDSKLQHSAYLGGAWRW